MSTTRQKYVDKCWVIRKAEPKYVLGASDTKECDCIGMTKYGLRENGVSFSTSGTNYTFRHQVTDIRDIKSAADLKFGDVVFKYKAPGEAGYNLPSKYKKGGSEYNGDLNDYCHIGTVASVNPLKIIHMTGPTAKTDTSIGKWKKAASLKPEYISDSPDPSPSPDPGPSPETKTMYVYAENGKPVNMRTKPDIHAALVEKVPVGASVLWQKDNGAGWAYIQYHGKNGWMMDCFLTEEVPGQSEKPVDADIPDEPADSDLYDDTDGYPVGEELSVWAENGKPVKLRQKPSTNCKIYDDVPVGAVVTLVQFGQEWCKVDYGTRKGWYMMTKFLGVG